MSRADTMRIDLRNQVALVTGSTGRLGRVIAATLADCGADVILHYFTQAEAALRLKEEVETRGVRAMCIQGDITDPGAVEHMRTTIANEFSMPGIVVANAVIQYRWTTVLQQSIEDYESQFKSNILQQVLLAKSFVPSMVDRQGGRIIAVSTECAVQNHPNQSAYVAGKRGMDGLLRVLAREIGPHNITVNQVAPGWISFDENKESAPGKMQSAYISNVPLRRRGKPQDVANLVAFLASDLAGFITGAFISVSGGNVMPSI